MRVLVTNGETRPALAITRSLGRRGDEVIVAAERHPSLASASRHCAGREFCPQPARSAGKFVDVIIDIASRRQTQLLLPVTEIAATLLAENRERLPPGCVLPLPEIASLRLANDKSRVITLAHELGVPVPATDTISSPAELPGAADLPFPIVVKPARSRVLAASHWLSASVDYAGDRAELDLKLGRLAPEMFPVLLQERIVGPGIGVFACYRQGHAIAMFSHRRLREKPPSGGVSVLCESIALDPLAADYAGRLLAALRWHGVAMVEFKRDDRDGGLRLMEINGRFWGSLQLAVDAGVDFPAIVASMAADEPIVPLEHYRTGVRSRWFLGDLDALLATLFHDAKSLNLAGDRVGRLRTLWQFLKSSPGEQRNEVFRLADPGPGLLELRHWLGGGHATAR
jgi:predicted ATP-grasp superfamily ATP-dependent carboligase